MAHFISVPGYNYLDSNCLIKVPYKEVTAAHFPRKLSAPDSKMNALNSKEQQIILRMCEKLSDRQILKIQQENEISLNRRFQKLKQKLRSSAKVTSFRTDKYFDSKDPDQRELSTLLKNHPQKIDVTHKYYMKVQAKMGSLRQAKEINSIKQQYRSWLNTCKNSPVKSPNYTKMNYVLQKVNEKRELREIIQPLRHSCGNKANSVVIQVKKQDYSPKNRRHRLVRNVQSSLDFR